MRNNEEESLSGAGNWTCGDEKEWNPSIGSNPRKYYPRSRLYSSELSPISSSFRKSSATGPPFLSCFLNERLFSREFLSPLLHFDQHDIAYIFLLVFHQDVPGKNNEIDRVPDETGISRRKRKLQQK
jgi:hypothetical protein